MFSFIGINLIPQDFAPSRFIKLGIKKNQLKYMVQSILIDHIYTKRIWWNG